MGVVPLENKPPTLPQTDTFVPIVLYGQRRVGAFKVLYITIFEVHIKHVMSPNKKIQEHSYRSWHKPRLDNQKGRNDMTYYDTKSGKMKIHTSEWLKNQNKCYYNISLPSTGLEKLY